MAKEFLPPTGRTYLAIRNQERPSYRAFSEWIDNSFGEGRGNASLVRIRIDGRRVDILDDGNAPTKLGDVAQVGAGAASGGYDPGRFGFGGSAAQLAFCSRSEMWALRADGMSAHDVVDWDRVVRTGELWVDSEWKQRRVPRELKELGHGLLLCLTIRDGKRLYRDAIRNHLAREYASALRAGKRIEWSQDGQVEALTPWSPGDLQDVVREQIAVTDGLTAEIEAGWSERLPWTESGLEIEFGPRRLCKTSEPLEGYSGASIFGWIRLLGDGWVDHLNTEKGGIENDHLRERVYEEARRLLTPLMDFLAAERRDRALVDIAGEFTAALGSLIGKSRGQEIGFPDTADWEVHGRPRPEPPDKPEEPQKRSKAKRELYIRAESDEYCGERPWIASTPLTGAWELILNEDIGAIKRALEERPPDRPLVHQWIASAIALELLLHDQLEPLGIYTAAELEELSRRGDEEPLKMAPFVIRRLLEAVDAA